MELNHKKKVLLNINRICSSKRQHANTTGQSKVSYCSQFILCEPCWTSPSIILRHLLSLERAKMQHTRIFKYSCSWIQHSLIFRASITLLQRSTSSWKVEILQVNKIFNPTLLLSVVHDPWRNTRTISTAISTAISIAISTTTNIWGLNILSQIYSTVKLS